MNKHPAETAPAQSQLPELFSGLLAALPDGDGLYSINELHALAGRIHSAQLSTSPADAKDAETTDVNISEVVEHPEAADSPFVSDHGLNVDEINAGWQRRDITVRPENVSNKSLRRFARRAGSALAAVLVVVIAAKVCEPDSNVGADARFPARTEVNTTLPEQIEQADIITQATVATEDTLTVTAATTVPSIVPTTQSVAPETTASTVPETTTTAETLPEKTLYQQLLNGEANMLEQQGMPLGILSIDRYCEDIELYIANPVQFKLQENWPYLTDEARVKIEELKNPKLTSKQKLMLTDDILQSGLPSENGIPTGEPAYTLIPDRTPTTNCVPEENPREDQKSYGSTEATDYGNKGYQASYWQPMAEIFAATDGIPGRAGITYISGHRSSQSAAFNALHTLNNRDTLTYSIDGGSIKYQFVGMEQLNEAVILPDLIARLNQESNDADRLVLQVCVEGAPNDRALYLFDRIQS